MVSVDESVVYVCGAWDDVGVVCAMHDANDCMHTLVCVVKSTYVSVKLVH